MFYPRATVAQIDLAAFHYNLKQIRKLLKPQVLLMAVVKADAYGHGLKRISQECEKANVDWLGVSCIYEVMKIREVGVRLPVLNLGPILPQETPSVFQYDYRPTITNFISVKKISKEAIKLKRKIKVHIKVDTGLNRIGFKPNEVLSVVKAIKKLPQVEIEGIFTHFANADEIEREATDWQLNKFLNVIEQLKKNQIKIPLIHAANSGATLWFPKSHFNLVRTGTLIYGISPNPKIISPIKLKPILTLKTFITHIKKVPIHTPISYGWTFYTRRESIIASLATGYGDGFSRSPNWGKVLVKGKFVSIVGRVCMDQSLIDITLIEGVKVGDEVILIGKQGKNEINLYEVSEKLGTIPHEILTSISARVTRVYI